MVSLDHAEKQRLDQKVVELMPRLSRAFASTLIVQGRVSVNGKPETKPGYKLRSSDTVTVNYDLTELDAIPKIDLPVLYEDNTCVVINKPVGVLTHSKGVFNPEATVATWLRDRVRGLEGERAGIVHRLDRATSGVMICAKTPEALAWLQKQFSQRKSKKTYHAIVGGQMPHDHAVIDMPIERNPKRPQTFRVGVNGKAALTEYWVSASNGTLSLSHRTRQESCFHDS